jgi:hypothetical protein
MIPKSLSHFELVLFTRLALSVEVLPVRQAQPCKDIGSTGPLHLYAKAEAYDPGASSFDLMAPWHGEKQSRLCPVPFGP